MNTCADLLVEFRLAAAAAAAAAAASSTIYLLIAVKEYYVGLFRARARKQVLAEGNKRKGFACSTGYPKP